MRRLENKKDSTKWHLRYLQMAELVAGWSKHPDFKVGAVAVGDFGQILSTGYNGWPRGMVDEEQGRQDTNRRGFSYTIHAELNVICNANLTGTSLMGSTIYVFPVPPCEDCAMPLVQVGVSKICYKDTPDTVLCKQKWGRSWEKAEHVFRQADVKVVRING